ncbi:MAG: hypothetical protein LPK92_03440 [Actinomycetes bacterium]|nr:hypothetical protein [Actinomycetes bacterium]
MALVASRAATPGTTLEVDVRGKPLPMEVTVPPFYKRQS